MKDMEELKNMQDPENIDLENVSDLQEFSEDDLKLDLDIRNSLNTALDIEGITVSEDLFARTLARIRAEQNSADDKVGAEQNSAGDKAATQQNSTDSNNNNNIVQIGGKKPKWHNWRIWGSVAAALLIGIVGIGVLSSGVLADKGEKTYSTTANNAGELNIIAKTADDASDSFDRYPMAAARDSAGDSVYYDYDAGENGIDYAQANGAAAPADCQTEKESNDESNEESDDYSQICDGKYTVSMTSDNKADDDAAGDAAPTATDDSGTEYAQLARDRILEGFPKDADGNTIFPGSFAGMHFEADLLVIELKQTGDDINAEYDVYLEKAGEYAPYVIFDVLEDD